MKYEIEFTERRKFTVIVEAKHPIFATQIVRDGGGGWREMRGPVTITNVKIKGTK